MSQVRSLSGPPNYKYIVFIDNCNKVSILEPNFVSELECNQILDTVNLLSNKWQVSERYPCLNFLPFSLYASDYSSYLHNAKFYQILMYDNFAHLYEKIRDKLSKILGMELQFHPKLNFPGFHITNGKAMQSPNFHVDGFHQLDQIFIGKEKFYYKKDQIVSIVLPISTISDKDGLLYRTTNLSEKYRQKLVYDEFLEYKPGMLAMWNGKLQHSMNPYGIHSNSKRRITLQCHIVFLDKGYIFW